MQDPLLLQRILQQHFPKAASVKEASRFVTLDEIVTGVNEILPETVKDEITDVMQEMEYVAERLPSGIVWLVL